MKASGGFRESETVLRLGVRRSARYPTPLAGLAALAASTGLAALEELIELGELNVTIWTVALPKGGSAKTTTAAELVAH